MSNARIDENREDLDPVKRRQSALRQVLRRVADSRPVGGVIFSLLHDGSLNSVAAGIEPEHIELFIAGMAELTLKLREHQANASPTKSQSAQVIHLHF